MRSVPDWDDYFMGLARMAASRSKDPNTQVGCVIVRANTVLATGYNGFAPYTDETPERWERPEKYKWVIHAEVNAIARAARDGISISGSLIYCTYLPCDNCIKVLAAAGVLVVVYDKTTPSGNPEVVRELAHGMGMALVKHEARDEA